MPENMALIEKRRKKERQEWWRKILAYYMMEKIADEKRKAEILRNYAMYHTAIVIEEGMLSLLFRKEPGRMSAMEILEQMEDEDLDSPFGKLLQKVRKEPVSEKETEEAIAEVIDKAPPLILRDVKTERERQEALIQQEKAKQEQNPEARPAPWEPDQQAIRFGRQLRLKLAFLKQVMPAPLFGELVGALAREGHVVNVNALDIPDPPQLRVTYQSYIAEKQARLQVHNNRFVNADNVYTSAAYMLAAYEQKNMPVFNAERADERARELFGSKAFRVYLDTHPGSLVAASQNTFLDITHEGLMKLETEIAVRDETLAAVSRSLRRNASGQTANYHRMLNKMERMAASPVEPSDAEKKALITAIGDYVLKDCAPGSQVGDEAAMKEVLCAARVLMPEERFGRLLEQVNTGRTHPIAADEIRNPNQEAGMQPPQPEGPVLANG